MATATDTDSTAALTGLPWIIAALEDTEKLAREHRAPFVDAAALLLKMGDAERATALGILTNVIAAAHGVDADRAKRAITATRGTVDGANARGK